MSYLQICSIRKNQEEEINRLDTNLNISINSKQEIELTCLKHEDRINALEYKFNEKKTLLKLCEAELQQTKDTLNQLENDKRSLASSHNETIKDNVILNENVKKLNEKTMLKTIVY